MRGKPKAITIPGRFVSQRFYLLRKPQSMDGAELEGKDSGHLPRALGDATLIHFTFCLKRRSIAEPS
jgi:hypothetical protein